MKKEKVVGIRFGSCWECPFSFYYCGEKIEGRRKGLRCNKLGRYVEKGVEGRDKAFDDACPLVDYHGESCNFLNFTVR